jgi:hypothetical protein
MDRWSDITKLRGAYFAIFLVRPRTVKMPFTLSACPAGPQVTAVVEGFLVSLIKLASKGSSSPETISM